MGILLTRPRPVRGERARTVRLAVARAAVARAAVARGAVARAAAACVAVALVAGCGSPQPTPRPVPSGSASIGSSETSIASGTAASGATPSPATPSLGGGPSPTGATQPSPSSPPYPLPAVSVRLAPLVAGLSSPVAIADAGDKRLFIVEQAGRIVVETDGRVSGTFLDLSGRVSCCGERGLLGLAFHPAYASNGRFFVRYTDPTGDVRISEFSRSGSDPNRADAASERVLLTVPHREFPNHNGGAIAFGRDGFLYIGTGDGGGGGDPHGNGQNLDVLLGKLLRIDVDHPTGGGVPYGIPSDNPFTHRPGARPEIWSYGLRNPYRFSFDRATGDLWIADVGQDRYEEVDRATVADGLGRGANYGWNVLEAAHCYDPPSGCDAAGKTPPLAEYAHGSNGANGCAIIGGFVYRGSAHPDLAGRYFFGDDCSGKIWDLAAAGPPAQTPQLLLDSGLQITGWGEAVDGELYVAAANGKVYQLT